MERSGSHKISCTDGDARQDFFEFVKRTRKLGDPYYRAGTEGCATGRRRILVVPRFGMGSAADLIIRHNAGGGRCEGVSVLLSGVSGGKRRTRQYFELWKGRKKPTRWGKGDCKTK